MTSYRDSHPFLKGSELRFDSVSLGYSLLHHVVNSLVEEIFHWFRLVGDDGFDLFIETISQSTNLATVITNVPLRLIVRLLEIVDFRSGLIEVGLHLRNLRFVFVVFNLQCI